MTNSALLGSSNGGIALPSDYKANYTFDTDATDTTGNYDGTPSGGVTYDGVSAIFDGVDNQIDISSINTATLVDNVSICGWVKANATRLEYIFFSQNGAGATQIRIEMGATGIMSAYLFISSFSSKLLQSTTNVGDGNYHLFALTRGANVTNLYIDATLEATNTETFVVWDDNNIIKLGWSGLAERMFTGNESNFKIYPRALTQEEVTLIYNDELAEHS